ncbi:MAG: sugar phosphate isomerase/epimerase [Ruminococcus sp.]|nr:sugar phosphate isomerase/epimerase [Ruminococcus sp.]
MQAGVSTACLYPKLLEDALYELAVNGIAHTELFINADCELRRPFVATMAELMSRFGVTCRSLHHFAAPIEPMMLFSVYERRVGDLIDYYKHSFEAMQTLGAEIFVLHGNAVHNPVPADFYCERFMRLAEAARPYGVIVAQENVVRCQSGSLKFLEEMKAQMGDEIRFVLDVKQAIRAGENPHLMLQRLGSNVVHVHISDHSEKGDCLQLGTGRFRIRAFLEEVYRHSPECSVMLELYRSSYRGISDLVSNYRMLSRMIAGVEKAAEETPFTE